MSQPVVGDAVYLRRDLTDAQKTRTCFLKFQAFHDHYAGHIAIVIKADTDNTVKLFLGIGEVGTNEWWRNEWVTVIHAGDEARFDARLVAKLRDDFRVAHPGIAASCGLAAAAKKHSPPSLAGRWVRIRTDLSENEKKSKHRFINDFTGDKASFAGRIGIVRAHDTDDTARIFFAPDLSEPGCWWWELHWFTVLSAADVAKLDSKFAADLQDSFACANPSLADKAKRHGDDDDDDTAIKQASKRLKTVVADVRTKLAELDRTIDALK